MRLAVFGDIHSNYHALEAVLGDIAGRGVDQLICLGDITLKGPLPKECVDRVRALGCPVVLGNADGAYHPDFPPSVFPPRNQSQVETQADFERHVNALTDDDRLWLHGFPLTYTQSTQDLRIDFFHAVPDNNYVLLMPWATNEQLGGLRLAPETRISFFGHCHRAFIRNPRGLMVINPGSVGIPFDGDPRPSYAIVDLNGGRTAAQLVRVPYDAEAAIRAAQDVGMQGWELFAHTARTGLFPG